jgi:hypothetical protein
MKALIVVLALAVLPAWGQQAGSPIAPIALYTSFQQQPPPAVLEALQDEVESIMFSTGLKFEWRTLSGVQGNEVSVELAVLTFKGRCDVQGLINRGSHAGALGWTHVSDGVILPFSDVDCDGIRKFLQKGLIAIQPAERAAAYGRAIGRVLAHELYHIFADTKQHASYGIAKEAYSSQDLLSASFRLEDRESNVLRSSKAHVVLENAVAGDSSRP